MEKDQELLEGFNAGYIIEKHRPELAKQLVDGLAGVEIPFVEGFIAGSNQSLVEKDLTRSKIVSKLKEVTKKNAFKSTKSKGKDDSDKGFEIEI